MEDEDDLATQNDEIEILTEIYGDNLQLLPSSSGKSFSIKLDHGANFQVDFPRDYPSKSSLKYDVIAPFLSKDEKADLDVQMKDILSSFENMPVTFALSECIKEFLESKFNNGDTNQEETANTDDSMLDQSSATKDPILPSVKCPAILTGDCIEDRKSVFQGHYA